MSFHHITNLKGPRGEKGDPGDVAFTGIDPGITIRARDVLIGNATVPALAAREQNLSIRDLTAETTLDELADGMYAPRLEATASTLGLPVAASGSGSRGLLTVYSDSLYESSQGKLYRTMRWDGLDGTKLIRRKDAVGSGQWAWGPWRRESPHRIDISANFAERTNGQVTASRSGSVVNVNGIALKFSSSGTTMFRGAVPAGYRPDVDFAGLCVQHRGTDAWRCAILPGGNFSIFEYTTGSWVRFSFTYLTADPLPVVTS